MQRTYEVAIYNEEVRTYLQQGKRHQLDPRWAETHYMEIKANSEQEARKAMARRYPSDQGYVIVDVYPLKYED
ncbi:MAG: hypothetical protein MI741_13775 [Rhodospirillales bacterium]|nr:hypothetical protein [Rhodospirillales bacterium]